MRDVLRFLFSAADAARIDITTIKVQDQPYASAPVGGKPYPQSMVISFSLASGETVAPQVRALFPGTMTFLADAEAPGDTPEPDQVAEAAYAKWNTRGTLMVAICKPGHLAAFSDQFGSVDVVPTIVWYSGIVLTKEFLFGTLVTHLDQADICHAPNLPSIRPIPRNGEWEKHAISGFLRGKYRPQLPLGKTAPEDAVTRPMPAVTDTGRGSFRLVVSCGARGRPHDARQAALDDLAQALYRNGPALDRDEPAHPANGAIPARHVYRLARDHMIDAKDNPAAAAILQDWPSAPRYFAIRCTRTWKVHDNISIHFPQQRIQVRQHATRAVLAGQRVAVHGVFYLAQEPTTPTPTAPHVDVGFLGYMRWIDGKTDHVWRAKASMQELPIDFSQQEANRAHIQLRLPMSDAIMKEPFDAPGGTICTYLSMRRCLRALIDNRIAGGRLNFGRGRTSQATRALIDAAWSETDSTLQSKVVADNQPPIFVTPSAADRAARRQLLPIWVAFFPSEAGQVDAGGNRRDQHTIGRVAYEIWQSNPVPVRDPNSRDNYPDDVIGRGAAGALVVSGLAAGYAVDGLRKQSDASEDAYLNRVANEMMTELTAGAALQFWNNRTDFDALRNRAATVVSYGHSPIYRENLNDRGIQVIDQYGVRNCCKQGTSNSERIKWNDQSQEIWIATNWDE